MSYLVLDVETTTKISFKRKANPFDPANWIVMAGWKTAGTDRPAGRRFTKDDQHHIGWLGGPLRNPGTKLLVGVNIKFDLLHLCKDPHVYEAYQDYVARGGNVWDCQLAEYLLDGQVQSSHMLSMDDMAARYGLDLKVDEVKALWEAGVATEDIDPALLSRYLLGEDLVDPITGQPTGRRREGDIGNTEAIFLKQLERARKSGQVKSILMNMGALLCSIEMERNGMAVNREKGVALAAQLELDIAATRERMQQYLPPDLPFEFNWSSRHQLSPLIFGGRIKYQRRQYDLKDGTQTWIAPGTWMPTDGGRVLNTWDYAFAQRNDLQWVLNDGTLTDVPPAKSSDVFAYATFKGGKNAGEYKTKNVKVDDPTKPKSRMADCYWEFPGYTKPDEEWAAADEGLYSVASDVIEALGNRNIPFLKDLARFKSMEKDLGTYFIKYDEKKGEHVGMLTLVQPDGIIHHSINHTSTVTGRFSSSNPNLQNIPKGNKSDIKTVFESRFDDGVIIQSDFSSLEIYVQAILTHCANLIADLKAGIDLHCMRLSLKEHMEYGEVFKLAKGYRQDDGTEVPPVAEWDYKRTGAKVFSFQRAYGAGAKKIASSTGMDLAEVEALILAEQARYPEVDTYFDKRAIEIKANRKPTNLIVPHPELPAIMCQLGISRVQTPDNKVYTYRESPSPGYLAKRGTFASFSPTEIKNYEVQGEGGEWMKAAMWLMVREFYRRRNFDGGALLVNTVHDAAYADAMRRLQEAVSAVLHACMEAASDFMEWYFGWPLPLPVPSDTVWGESMAEENKFTDPTWKAAASDERAALRARYMDGYTPSYLQ